jgi:hypothetical protein
MFLKNNQFFYAKCLFFLNFRLYLEMYRDNLFNMLTGRGSNRLVMY